ncbi:hypothetical protein BDV18DRAFT_119643 [Aspergillus unguis]
MTENNIVMASLKKKQAAVSLKQSSQEDNQPATKQEMQEMQEMQEIQEKKEVTSKTVEAPPTTTTTITTKPEKTEPTTDKVQETTKNSKTTEKLPPQLQEENTLLAQKLTSVQSDLQEAQDFIFSLQPRHQTLTEAEAIEEYASLSCAIDNWVDVHLADALDDKTIATEHLTIEDATNLMTLIPPPGKAALNIPGTDVDNIQALIWRYLNDVIFSQDFYCPLPRHEREFLANVERAMRTLSPRRDTRAIRHWRIETYTAASNRPGFTEYTDTRKWNLATHLTKALLPFAPEDSPESLSKSLLEAIIKPAFELGRKMHLCFDEYTLEWSTWHDRAIADPIKVFEEESERRFDNYEFVSLTDRKIMRKPKEGDDGVRVKWLFDLAPKLVFRRLKADSWSEGKVLVKSKVLVRVYKPRKGPPVSKEEGNKIASRKDEGHKPVVQASKKDDGHKTVLGEVQNWLETQIHLAETEKEKEGGRLRMRGVRPAAFMGLFN